MTNRNKIVLLTFLALALTISQSNAQQQMYPDVMPPEKPATIDLNQLKLQLQPTTPATTAAAPATTAAAPATTAAAPATPTLTLTPVKQEVSQNVAIIQSIEKIENSVEKIKGLYSLMQQAAGQDFDKEKESQKAFAVALVDAFNDARTANAYMQQLLQAAAQTPLLNTEQQKYVAQTMIPLVADKAAQTTQTAPAATPPTAAAVAAAATPPAATATAATAAAAAAAQIATTPPAATAAAQIAATPPATTVAAPAATTPAAKAPVAKPATKKIVKKVVKKTAAKKPAPKKTVVKKTITKPAAKKTPIAKMTTAAAPAAK